MDTIKWRKKLWYRLSHVEVELKQSYKNFGLIEKQELIYVKNNEFGVVPFISSKCYKRIKKMFSLV